MTSSRLSSIATGTMRGYAAVFFSDSLWFGGLLCLITLLCPVSGVCGLLSCALVNTFATLFHWNDYKTSHGIWGFNAVLMGIAVGLYYPVEWKLMSILLGASLGVGLLTRGLDRLGERWRLPFLAFPFLFCIWILLVIIPPSWDALPTDWGFIWIPFSLPPFVADFFRSLSVVFFRYDMLLGMMIAVGLFCVSRVAFLYSFACYSLGYLINWIFPSDLPYPCLAFNYILTALSVGTCYLLPSRGSLALSLLLVPVQWGLSLFIPPFSYSLNLPSFSFVFCIVSLVALLVVSRWGAKWGLRFPVVWLDAPEKRVDYARVSASRFSFGNYYSFRLPFMGQWSVSQGHQGCYTHKGVWANAWDFVVKNELGNEYWTDGTSTADYCCFGSPVLATADGEVVDLRNDVVDNVIGARNEVDNWGNYVMLRHAEGLYSLVAHLRRGSVEVKLGERVRRGALLGMCGNSGLSPFPHLHFQFQSTPYVGDPTLSYPFSFYLGDDGASRELRLTGLPVEAESLSPVGFDKGVAHFYDMRSGVCFESSSDLYGTQSWQVEWESGFLLRCLDTGAEAHFVVSDTLFSFFRFSGSTHSNLYLFYLSNFRVIYDRKQSWNLFDEMPIYPKTFSFFGLLQDFCVPFAPVLRQTYRLTFGGDSPMAEAGTNCLCAECAVENRGRREVFSSCSMEMVSDDLLEVNGMLRRRSYHLSVRRKEKD